MLAAYLFWDSFFQRCTEREPHWCLPCPWRRQQALFVSMGTPFLMSAYLHIRTAQSQGEGEGKRGSLSRRSQGEGGEIKQWRLHGVSQ